MIENNEILLVNHSGLTPNSVFWNPPGGGLEFKENAKEALVREFKEETLLDVQVENFLFVNEFTSTDFHAIELFFEVSRIGGELGLGGDPEHRQNQLLKNVAFFSLEEIRKLPKSSVHSTLHDLRKINDIFDSAGYSWFSAD